MIGHIIHHIDKYGYSAGAACTETFQRTDHAIARRQKKTLKCWCGNWCSVWLNTFCKCWHMLTTYFSIVEPLKLMKQEGLGLPDNSDFDVKCSVACTPFPVFITLIENACRDWNTVECCLAYVLAYGVESYGITHCSFVCRASLCVWGVVFHGGGETMLRSLLGVESYDCNTVSLFLFVDQLCVWTCARTRVVPDLELLSPLVWPSWLM